MKAQKFETHLRRQPAKTRRRLTIAATIAIGASGAACNEDAAPTPGTDKTYAASLAAFESCDALDNYITDAAVDAIVLGYGYGYRGGVDFDAPTAGDDALGGNGGEGAPSGPDDFTGTNNQELGVDESDMVKTDGTYTYVLSQGTLHILEAWPAEEMHEVATVELPGWGDDMFLHDDRVIVFSYIYTGEDPYRGGWGGEPEPWDDDEPGEEPPAPVDPLDDGAWFAGTRVTILDVSDPSAPEQAAVFDIQGDFVNARLVDGKVYLVTRSNLLDYYSPGMRDLMSELDLPEYEWDATPEEREAAAELLRERIRPAIAEYVATEGRAQLIPDFRTTDSDRADLFSCGELMRPGAASGLSVLSVVGFDGATASPEGVGVIADGWQVYGSQESLYVAQDSRWWSWGTPEDAFSATHIHKFALNGGSPVYRASGEVEGWLLDQFSMSEHEGVLRVATTDQTNFGWAEGGDVAVSDGGEAVEGGGAVPPSTPDASDAGGPDSDSASDGPEAKAVFDLRDDPTVDANNVFTLRENGAELEVIGGIRGIAPGEQIFAVRFMGDTGYVVTFEQVDPLFVVDLSDPAAPELRGELHIPGYSGYLHPLGDDHLIGIGRDGTDEGQILGVQISLFDVSNPDAPTRVDKYSVAHGDGFYGWSEAEHDHHAFTFYESRGLLAIPMTLEDYGWEDDSYSHFSGLVVFHIDTDGIEEFGRVSHTMMAHDRYCGDFDPSDPEPAEACASYDYPWWVNMRRSIFADDYLYAISDMGVTASSLESVEDVVAEVRYE